MPRSKPSASAPLPPGRPTKFTPSVRSRILKGIKLGMSYEMAAQYGGVNYDTFNEWRKRGAAEEVGEYSDFSEELLKAEAEGLAHWLQKIETAANKGDWTAAAWKAERRYPHLYGRRVQEHTGEHGGPIQIRLVRETGFNPSPQIEETDEDTNDA